MQDVAAPPPPAVSLAGGTNPAAAARAASGGLPVSWPIPTEAQNRARPTHATAAANAHARGEAELAGRALTPEGVDALQAPLLGLLAQMPGGERKQQDVGKRLEELWQKLREGG